MHVPGGGTREDTCDHGLSRRSLRGKNLLHMYCKADIATTSSLHSSSSEKNRIRKKGLLQLRFNNLAARILKR